MEMLAMMMQMNHPSTLTDEKKMSIRKDEESAAKLRRAREEVEDKGDMIVCLQCFFYATLGMFLSLLVGTRVSRMSLVYFFDYAAVSASTITGWSVIASFVLPSIAGAGYMFYLIERAKKCLDFSATLYLLHLFICITYGGWPSSLTWWVVNISGLATMALLGEYLCIRRELQDIPITQSRSNV